MYCKHCGKEIINMGKYCEYCGQEIDVQSNEGKKDKEDSNVAGLKGQKKGSRKNLLIVSCVLIAALIAAGIFYSQHIKSPETFVSNYIKAVNARDFDKVYECFTEIPDSPFISKEAVIEFLNFKAGQNQVPVYSDIHNLKENGTGDEAFITVDCDYMGDRKMETIHVKKGKDNKWRIPFPYSPTSVAIYTLEGAQVIFDGAPIEDRDGRIDIPGVLEGEYDITVVFDETMTDPIETKVLVKSGDSTFWFEDFAVNEDFQNEMFLLVENYNKAWQRATVDNDLSGLREYMTEQKFEEDQQYLMRSKENYQYIFSNFEIEPDRVEVKSGDCVLVFVTEKWHFKRHALNGNIFTLNERQDLEQKQTLEWVYLVVRENGQWKVNDGEYSAISKMYLDNNGNWVEY